MKYTPYFLLAFLLGVLARSFFDVPQNWIVGGAGLVIGFLAVLFFGEKLIPYPLAPSTYEGEGDKKEMQSLSWGRGYTAVLAITLFFFLGALRFSIFENNIIKDELHNHYGETMTLRSAVISSKIKPNSSRIILETDLGRILVVSRIYPQYKYGDKLEVRGEMLEPENSPNFDAKKYLAKQRIYSQMLFPEIKKLSYEPENKMLGILFSIKEKFQQNLKIILPEPHASLANGMLLGEEGVLPRNLLDAFRKTSTIHILVLSGYNITIVGNTILAFFGYVLPQAFAWTFSVLGIILFTLMTGAEPAAVRAAIMAVIGLLALRTGRLREPILALLLAAGLMVFINPMYLRFDRGFQLSFAATLGLVLLASRFQKFFWFLPKSGGVREAAAASASAQIFVLPFLLAWGNAVSIFTLPANILIVTAVPYVMLFSFLGGVAAFLSSYSGAALGAVSYILIIYQIYVVEFFSRLNI